MSVSKVLRTVLIAVIVATAAGSSTVVATSDTSTPPESPAGYEGPGSASAEDAVSTYMDGLAAADVDVMASSFAVETFVQHFDLRAHVERIQVYQLGAMPLLLPPETPFTEALAVEQRHSEVIEQILFQTLRLVDPEFDPTQGINLSDATELEEFYSGLATATAALDTTEAGSFDFVPLAEVDPQAAELYESEQNQANLDAQREILGADEVTDLVVRFSVGGREFFAFFSMARYGDAWWIDRLGGNFAQLVGIPFLDVGAAPIDEPTD